MSRLHAVAALLLVITAPIAPRAEDAAPDAARVNGVAISEARLKRALDAYIRQNAGGRTPAPDQYRVMRRQVLDVLIGRELLWQDAQALGVVVSEEETREALARLEKQLGTPEAFAARLRASGVDRAEYVADLRRRLSLHRLVNDHLSQQIDVTRENVETYYRENLDRFRGDEQVRARHILIKLPPDAGDGERDAALERLRDIRRQLDEGAEFPALAKVHSQGPSAPRGGDLGFFGRGRMVAPFEEAAFGLEPGEVSQPVTTRFGVHLIKVESRRGGEARPLEAVEDRIRQHLYGVEQRRLAGERARMLRKAARIELPGEVSR